MATAQPFEGSTVVPIEETARIGITRPVRILASLSSRQSEWAELLASLSRISGEVNFPGWPQCLPGHRDVAVMLRKDADEYLLFLVP